MKRGILHIKTNVNSSFKDVKSAFVDRNGELLKYLCPKGTSVVHHKGIRRGAVTKIDFFGDIVKFKVVGYKTSKSDLFFNDILVDGNFLGIKFWSHRHKLKAISDDKTMIEDEVTFTTKSAVMDWILHICLFVSFVTRKLKYKLFFK